MRVLRLAGGGLPALDLHPYLAVVTGAGDTERARLLDALTALAARRAGELDGVIEVAGLLVPIAPGNLALLGALDPTEAPAADDLLVRVPAPRAAGDDGEDSTRPRAADTEALLERRRWLDRQRGLLEAALDSLDRKRRQTGGHEFDEAMSQAIEDAIGRARSEAERARRDLEEAERAARPLELAPEDAGRLEAAHARLERAERRAGRRLSGRLARRALRRAREAEAAELERLGLPSYGAYLMRSSLLGADPAAGLRQVEARLTLRVAEERLATLTESRELEAGSPDTAAERRTLLDALRDTGARPVIEAEEAGEDLDRADAEERLLAAGLDWLVEEHPRLLEQVDAELAAGAGAAGGGPGAGEADERAAFAEELAAVVHGPPGAGPGLAGRAPVVVEGLDDLDPADLDATLEVLARAPADLQLVVLVDAAEVVERLAALGPDRAGVTAVAAGASRGA